MTARHPHLSAAVPAAETVPADTYRIERDGVLLDVIINESTVATVPITGDRHGDAWTAIARWVLAHAMRDKPGADEGARILAPALGDEIRSQRTEWTRSRLYVRTWAATAPFRWGA